MALKIFALFFVYALYLAMVFTVMGLIVYRSNHSDLGTTPQIAQAELILLLVLVGLPPVLFAVNSLRVWIERTTTQPTDQEAIAADHQRT
jgi:Na+/proline symporter